MAGIIPAALSVGGGLLSLFGGHKKENQEADNSVAQQQNNINMGHAQWDQQQRTHAARAQLVRSILAGVGAPGAVDSGLMGQLTAPSAYPDIKTIRPAGGNIMQGLGGFLSGAGIGLSNLPKGAGALGGGGNSGGPNLLAPAPLGMPNLNPDNMWGADGSFDPNKMWGQ